MAMLRKARGGIYIQPRQLFVAIRGRAATEIIIKPADANRHANLCQS